MHTTSMLEAFRAPGARRQFLFIFGLVSIQGLTLNLLPVLFRTLGRTFGIGLGEEGQAQSLFYLGAVIALLTSGWVTERIGVKRSGLAVILLVGAGLFTLGLAWNYTVARVGALILGVGNQWVLSIYSSIVAARFQDIRQKMFMWIMAVLAGSASVGPVLLGYLLTRVPRWQWIFLIAGAGLWVAGSIWHGLVAKGLEPVTIRESGAAGERLSARDLLLSPALWLMGFLVTLDMLASGGILSWTPRLLQIRHGADETVAGLVLTAMTIGMLAGRIVLGVLVSGRLSDRVLLGGSYALAMAAYGALLLVPNQTTAFVLMVVVGAATSAQAPSIYSLATYKFATRAAVACPLVDAIGNLGGFAGPAGLGVLADRFGGLERVIWIAPALGFLLAAVSLGWELIDRWSARPPSPDATEAVMP